LRVAARVNRIDFQGWRPATAGVNELIAMLVPR
jgi:hypothetical protein